MANHSPTVVLNGHGIYSKDHLLDSCNYSLVFPCKLNSVITNGQSNLILNSLHQGIGNLATLEQLPSTFLTNNTVVINTYSINMLERETRYTYDHGLKNAPDVENVQTLFNINNQRYAEQNNIAVDYSVADRNDWNVNGKQGSFKINYNINQIENDVIAVERAGGAGININMSNQNLVYMTPTAAHGHSMSVKLSDMLSDILPKVKISVLYTPPALANGQGTAVVAQGGVFIDDGGPLTLTPQDRLAYFFPAAAQNDVYHDVIIGDNANIIWDACRELDT